ncbi:hypothetical protein PHJA_002280600 [Phtheirospermum japonicum]|uniref:Uncharacterized protein n=1 Tax=Phtheirospermum japonicum TaxID=374723 RepID=A0A830CPZ0_9LAMI|nr:hypothetical protein PHJA_002280600 [Phtheirospermum japonicum]
MSLFKIHANTNLEAPKIQVLTMIPALRFIRIYKYYSDKDSSKYTHYASTKRRCWVLKSSTIFEFLKTGLKVYEYLLHTKSRRDPRKGDNTKGIPFLVRQHRPVTFAQPRRVLDETRQQQTHQENEIGKRKRTSSDDRVLTRMSPKKLLSQNQRQAVKDIGFGSLLEIRINECDGKLCRYLVDNFDVCRCGLDFGKEEIILIEEDVLCTLDFPKGGLAVVEKNANEIGEYMELLAKWRERWGIELGSLITCNMADKIIERVDYGDWFIRDVVVFSMSSIIKGHTNRRSNYKILYSLIDVNIIKDLNWCAYTLTSLLGAIESWKNNPTSNFTSPLIFLLVMFQLSYLDRVQFKGRHVDRTLSMLSCWNSQAIRERVRDELRAGGFGKGLVLKRIRRAQEEHGEQSIIKIGDVQNISIGTIKNAKVSVHKLSSTFNNIASSLLEIGDVMLEIGLDQPTQTTETLRKTFNTLSQMFNNALHTQTQQIPTSVNPIYMDDDIFNDPAFLDVVTRLELAFAAANKSFDAPSFSLGLTQDETTPQRQVTVEGATVWGVSELQEEVQTKGYSTNASKISSLSSYVRYIITYSSLVV